MAADPSFPPLFEVPYLRLFPWLRLFRAPGGAADPKRLILAAVGLLLMKAGWDGLDALFPASAAVTSMIVTDFEPVSTLSAAAMAGRLAEPFVLIISPFRALFDPATDATGFAHACLAALWATLIWGLIGGAIARSAVVAFARGDRLSWGQIGRFLTSKAAPLVVTPLLPFVGVTIVAGSMALFGLLYRIPGAFGGVAAGLLAFLPLIGGLLLALIVILLGTGWPLMHASVAAEAEDSFDAMSRAYAYVHQRPWQLAGLAALALVLGVVGLAFVELFARLVVTLTTWALSFGGSSSLVRGFHGDGHVKGASAAAAAHAFWLSAVSLLTRGWVYSYFWTAASVVYLLLRHEVDGTPFQTIAYEAPPNLLAEAAAGPMRTVLSYPIIVRKPGPAPASTVPAPHSTVSEGPGEASGD